MNFIILYLVIILALFTVANAGKRQNKKMYETIELQMEFGLLQGRTDHSYSGRKYVSFCGIPYAVPPVGSLRFEDPIEYKQRFANGSLNAVQYKPQCLQSGSHWITIQRNGSRTYAVVGAENCLYVNVYTTTIDAHVSKRPVIFFIHAGAFSSGGTAEYEPDYVMNKDVIFVAVAYRVGIMGFLSTGDHVVPGNMGLKDQLLALKWVHKHIGLFGGDKTRISLAGIGAGAVSVHFMYLSPLTTGLFHNGYSYSGSALCPWATFENIPSRTKEIANYMNCPIQPSQAMVDCLRKADPREMVKSVKRLRVFLNNPFVIFGPVVDIASPRPYLPQTPRQLLVQGKYQDLPWVTGFTAENGLFPAGDYISNKDLLHQLMHNWNAYMPEILMYDKRCFQNMETDIFKAVRVYQKKYERSFNASLLQLVSERLYSQPAFLSAAYMSQRGYTNTYLYKFMYSSNVSFSRHLAHGYNIDDWPVAHRDDTAYIYNVDFINNRTRPRDRVMSEELLNLATSFANYSHFPDSFQMWEPARNNFSWFNYLEIAGPQEYFMNEALSSTSDEFLEILEKFITDC